jgi:hypothetical protein
MKKATSNPSVARSDGLIPDDFPNILKSVGVLQPTTQKTFLPAGEQ